MAQTTYDPDADQQHDTSAGENSGVRNYDTEFDKIAQKYTDDEFSKLTGKDNFSKDAEHPLGGKESSANELKQAEEKPAFDDTLGKGFNETAGKSKSLSAKLLSSSKLKKRIAIAGAAAGGSLIAGIGIFILMLPLKLTHVVDNLQSNYSASVNESIDEQTGNLFEAYMVKKVFVNFGKNNCHSTIDAGCVSVTNEKSPIGKLYNGWRDAKLENRLATDFGLEFGKRGDNTFYIKTDGRTIDLKNGESIFDSADGRQATRGEIRRIVNQRLREGTLYDRTILYSRAWALMESKYGIKRCLIACDTRDRFADSVANKKLAAKAYIVSRVFGPMNETYGLILQCVLAGANTAGCNPDLNGQEDIGPDGERTSAFHQKLREQLVSYRARYGATALDKLLKDAEVLSEKGIAHFMFTKVFGELGGTVASESLDKAIPVVGWVNLGAKSISFVGSAGPKLKAYNYAASSAAAVAIYSMYSTTSAEQKTGHMDPTILGSVIGSLGDDSNLDGKGADMTSSPAYGPIMGDSSTVASNAYKCNDGSRPTGMVCEEEKLNGGNKTATALTAAADSIPGFSGIKAVADAWNSTAGAILQKFGDAIGFLASLIPGVSNLEEAIASFISPLMQYVIDWLLPNPFAGNVTGSNANDGNVSGGRLFNMAAAGADVMANKQCQVQLGCQRQSDAATAAARNRQIATQKQTFENKPMFARMFDTTTSYSLISRLALATPTSLQTATNNGVATILANPFSRITGVVANMFSTPRAFAATGSQPDPFGVVQYGYNKADIPKDPEAYWNANCVNGPMGVWDETNNKLDVDAWLEKQQQDPDTGEAVSTNTNPCLLILTSAQGLGGLFDSSILPQNTIDNQPPSSTNNSTAITPGGNGGDGDDYGDACYRHQGPTYGVRCSGQCVDFVWYRLNKHITQGYRFWDMGNGNTAADRLASKWGYQKGNTPQLHAVVSWPAGGVSGPGGKGDPAFGHVAMVAKVNADGSMVVEEYNALVKKGYSSRTIPASTAAKLTYAYVGKDYK